MTDEEAESVLRASYAIAKICYRRMPAWARHMTSVHDLGQVGAIGAIQSIESYRDSGAARAGISIGTWAKTAIKNDILNEIDRHTGQTTGSRLRRQKVAEGFSINEHLASKNVCGVLETCSIEQTDAWKTLTPNAQVVMKLRHIDGKCWSEIAAVIGRNNDCVRLRLMRAVRQFRENLTARDIRNLGYEGEL
jgi:RNA polymerase sigma factor (sigma-70 family)